MNASIRPAHIRTSSLQTDIKASFSSAGAGTFLRSAQKPCCFVASPVSCVSPSSAAQWNSNCWWRDAGGQRSSVFTFSAFTYLSGIVTQLDVWWALPASVMVVFSFIFCCCFLLPINFWVCYSKFFFIFTNFLYNNLSPSTFTACMHVATSSFAFTEPLFLLLDKTF